MQATGHTSTQAPSLVHKLVMMYGMGPRYRRQYKKLKIQNANIRVFNFAFFIRFELAVRRQRQIGADHVGYVNVGAELRCH